MKTTVFIFVTCGLMMLASAVPPPNAAQAADDAISKNIKHHPIPALDIVNQTRNPQVEAALKVAIPEDFTATGTEKQPEGSGKIKFGTVLDPYIITGTPVSNIAQVPWQVAIEIDRKYFCGGSIISKTWILTAAHCAYDASSWRVIMGIILRSDSTRIISDTRSAQIHPQYNPIYIVNDIALLKLATAIPQAYFDSGRVNAIKLPPNGQTPYYYDNKTASVSGWGKTADNSTTSNSLNMALLQMVPLIQCVDVYGNETVTSKLICAVGINGTSTCNGDSGGPLVYYVPENNTFIQVGIVSIVSFGPSKGCTEGYPVGFTRVGGYTSFISATTGLAL